MKTANMILLTLTGILLVAKLSHATDTIPGNCLSFDGNDDQVEVPHNSDSNSGSFTLESWVRSTGSVGDPVGTILSTLWYDFMESTMWGFQLSVGSESDEEIQLMIAAEWNTTSVTGPAIRGDGQWHHVAGVYSGGLLIQKWTQNYGHIFK
jgi:hypothetical protein